MAAGVSVSAGVSAGVYACMLYWAGGGEGDDGDHHSLEQLLGCAKKSALVERHLYV